MHTFNHQAFVLEAKILAFVVFGILCNAVMAHNWIAVKWTLGVAGAILVGLAMLNSPKKREAQSEAQSTINSAGFFGIAVLALLAMILNGAVAAGITVVVAVAMTSLLSLRNGFGMSLGKTFAIGLPMLLAGQLIFETLYVSAI